MKKSKPQIYTIATAHLDTSWLWTLEQTIDEYIPDTLKRNFKLLESYPEYKFNFEGSLRYEFIKEYYPEEYEKLKKYIKDGRWNPNGSCYENGDVNIPSPEALTRNILYGNSYFRKEFGTQSNDIFLPDCFGFGKSLPTVAAHSGLTGFSTGKLMWGSSVPIPFDTGRWTGADGKGVWASLMPFAYTTALGPLHKAERILNKIKDNREKNLPDFTFCYHGVGDRGGSPHVSSVKNVIKAQRKNNDSQTEVYSATTKEFFEKLENMSEEEQKLFPVYEGEFLLTAHGAGSYTSRTVTKRWNRRCELLADAAERFASSAYIKGLKPYPSEGFDNAWKRVIAHHFHDDITGTSFEKCYNRTHNDYIQSLNTFSEEYTAACKALTSQLDTSFCKGVPVVVSNPVQGVTNRTGAVSVTIDSENNFFRVFDKTGKELPSQTKADSDNKKTVTFAAAVPSSGLAVFDVRESRDGYSDNTGLTLSENSLENKNIRVTIDKNGDIASIYDKNLSMELLKSPVRLSVLNNTHSFDWPAWEIKYEDCKAAPYMYAAAPVIKIRDNGPALISLEIIKTAGKSSFTQIISLDTDSRFISVYNETDWREEASLLKAEFSFTAENINANYDIGTGCVKRPTNTEKLYEVPAQKWADITDEKANFGVCVFSDSRSGWDKPDESTLRLTVVHTPMCNYRWECSQHIMDMGLNRYSFAIMGHEGAPYEASQYADCFCQPMHTFITDVHKGTEEEFSAVKLNNDTVRITALKKAQDSERIIFRVTESTGVKAENIEAVFPLPIKEAFEVKGDETDPKPYPVTDGKLRFSMDANSIRSFAIVFEGQKKCTQAGTPLCLNFNARGITADKDRESSTLKNGISVPLEITPDELLYTGVNYRFSKEKLNTLVCDGSKIKADGNKVNLLLTSLSGEKKVKFTSGNKDTVITVPDCFAPLGHWDLMQQGLTGFINPVPQAHTFTHTHNKNGNMTAKQLYLFCAEIPLDGNEITLPNDSDIVIFAATAVNENGIFLKGDEHFDSLEKREFDYEFSDYAKRFMYPNSIERFLDKFIDRTFSLYVKLGDFHNKYALDEAYYILRSLNHRRTYKKDAEKLRKSRENNK